MHRLTRRSFGLLFLAFFLAFAVTACGRSDSGEAAPGENADPNMGPFAGKLAPDFTLPTLNGQETVQLSSLRGKKVFLNFWASWCGPCKDEMPDIQEMARKYEGQILVYPINVTTDDDLENARRFLGSNSITLQSLTDPEGSAKSDYRIASLPVSLTIDGSGRVVERRNGIILKDQMESVFQKLLQAE